MVLFRSPELTSFHNSIISRNDNAFFSRAVKVLSIGDRFSGDIPSPDPDLRRDKVWASVKAVLNACRGVGRLALWIENCRDLEMERFTGKDGSLHPTRMSLLNLTADLYISKQDCKVTFLPGSLTHLNLDSEHSVDIDIIRWKDIYVCCPNLAHILLSGNAISDNFNNGELFSHVVEPIVAKLPDTVATITIVVEPEDMILRDDVHLFEEQLDAIAEVSNRFVVVCHDTSYRGQVQGLHVVENDHTLFDSEWGDWQDMDETWEFAERYVTNRRQNAMTSAPQAHVLSMLCAFAFF